MQRDVRGSRSTLDKQRPLPEDGKTGAALTGQASLSGIEHAVP